MAVVLVLRSLSEMAVVLVLDLGWSLSLEAIALLFGGLMTTEAVGLFHLDDRMREVVRIELEEMLLKGGNEVKGLALFISVWIYNSFMCLNIVVCSTILN